MTFDDDIETMRATVERLAAANQALTQRLDREHSMRLAAEADRDQWKSAAMMHTAGKVSAWNERDESERRAHEAEAALEALRTDVERDRASIRYRLPDVSGTMGQVAVHSVCELLAAWGRAQDVEYCRENRRRAVLFLRSTKEAIQRADDALYGRR